MVVCIVLGAVAFLEYLPLIIAMGVIAPILLLRRILQLRSGRREAVWPWMILTTNGVCVAPGASRRATEFISWNECRERRRDGRGDREVFGGLVERFGFTIETKEWSTVFAHFRDRLADGDRKSNEGGNVKNTFQDDLSG